MSSRAIPSASRMLNNTRRQPQRVPPPLLTGNERVDGQGILDELTGEEALVIWKTYRAVFLWSQIRPRQRKELVSTESYKARLNHLRMAPGLGEAAEAVEDLADLFRKTLPAPVVASRCRTIEEWAEQHDAPRTAVEFAQLVALASPSDAAAAARVGRRVRDLAEYARAESWYWEAIVRARKAGDWQAYVLSTLGLGITSVRRGNYPAARRSFERGVRRARRQGLTGYEAMAYHELTVWAIRTENLPQTVQFGRAASRLYGPDHPRLAGLAHDLATFWMNRGYFDVGFQVVSAIPPDFGTLSDQAVRYASVARAAGAIGSNTAFDDARAGIEKLLTNPQVASRAASVLLDLGRGALSLGRVQAATEIVVHANELARERGEAELSWDAESLLQEIHAAGAVQHAKTIRAPRRVLEFASELTENLLAIPV